MHRAHQQPCVACDDAPLPGIAQLKNIGACSLWHVDEVLLTIDGERHYVWPAADQDGHVPDIPVQRRRDKQAAKTFFRNPLTGLPYGSRVIISDRLKRHGAALRGLLPGAEHRQHRRKTPTDQHASGNDGCGGSSRPGTPGASSPRMGPLRRVSVRGATPSLLEHTGSR